MTLSAQDIAALLGARLTGDNVHISHLAPPEASGPGAVTVLFGAVETENLPTATLLVMAKNAAISAATSHIKVDDPKRALAVLSAQFDMRRAVAEGVHESAIIHSSANLAEDVHVGPGAVIGFGAELSQGVRVGARAVVGAKVKIGPNAILHPGVTLYEGTALGARVVLHSGVVIGADGFGYAPTPEGALKLHHLGRAVLEDDVEIGANSCVDRATLGETRIGARSKIDNLCQIGHNVRIGSDCFIAGASAIGGSTTLGNRVVVGGSVGIIDHLVIGDDVQLGARSLVRTNVPAGERWLGHPAKDMRSFVRDRMLLAKIEDFLYHRAAQEGADKD